jgi:hypothetical protein
VKEEGVNEKNNSRYKQDVIHPIVKSPLVKQSSKHVSNPLKRLIPFSCKLAAFDFLQPPKTRGFKIQNPKWYYSGCEEALKAGIDPSTCPSCGT